MIQSTTTRTILEPFEEFTRQVSKIAPTFSSAARMYVQLYNTLTEVTKKQGKFASYDSELILACESGLEKFNKYYDHMKENDIYYLATIFDPRIKFKWLKKNIPDTANQIISRLRTFLKATYSYEPRLPRNKSTDKPKSLEYAYLGEYASDDDDIAYNDIDRYFDSATFKSPLNPDDDQVQWVLDWWAKNSREYPLMAKAAREYLCIPSSEVDIERLFSDGRDILGVRRWALSGNTMRSLTLCKDELRRKEKS